MKEKSSSLDAKFSTYQQKHSNKQLNIMIQKRTQLLIMQVTTQFQFIKFFYHVKMIQLKTTKITSLMTFGYSHMMDKDQTSLIE